MSRWWDKDVLRRAGQIGAERCRRGEVGDWIGDQHQAYRERVRTPLERQIERDWSAPREEPPCRQQHGACNDVTRACLRCAAPFGAPCPQDDTATGGE